MTPNPEYVKRAKALRGQRAWLLGGGMPMNNLILCTVKRVTRDGHAVIDSGDAQIKTPLLMSWHVEPINPILLPQLADVPNGDYWFDSIKGGLYKQRLLSVKPFWYKRLDFGKKAA